MDNILVPFKDFKLLTEKRVYMKATQLVQQYKRNNTSYFQHFHLKI